MTGLDLLLAEQGGAVSRRQLLAAGMTAARVRWLVDSGRFGTLHPGVYAGFTGPVPALTRVWAAALYAGPAAAVGGQAALWLHGADDRVPDQVELCVPWQRRVRDQPGLRVVRRRDWERLVQFAPTPARLRLVEAMLDVSATCPEQEAAALVIQVVQRRLISADRLAQALAARAGHRWRGLLLELLEQVRDGVESPLERRYLLRVERPHGLPRGTRNATGQGRRRDVRYQPFGVVIELDGAASHRPESRHRDFARDRSAVLNGDRVLVYGWTDVVAAPCRSAAEVGAVLNRNGWAGRARPCGPTCPLGTS